jgi:hypothetical protein
MWFSGIQHPVLGSLIHEHSTFLGACSALRTATLTGSFLATASAAAAYVLRPQFLAATRPARRNERISRVAIVFNRRSERAKLAVQDEYGGVLGFRVAGGLRGRRRRVGFIDADAASESAPRPSGTSSRLNGLDFVWWRRFRPRAFHECLCRLSWASASVNKCQGLTYNRPPQATS